METTRVYEYGCRRPTRGMEVIEAQLRLYVDYYNALLEAEKKRRQEFRAIRERHFPDLATKEQELGEKLARKKEIKKLIKAAGGKRKAPAELIREQDEIVARVKELSPVCSSRRKECNRQLQEPNAYVDEALEGKCTHVRKRARVEVTDAMLEDPKWPQFWKDVTLLDRKALAETEQLRAKCGLYHGTYAAVEAAVARAFKDSQDPERKHFEFVGRIGVQIQPGYELPPVDQ